MAKAATPHGLFLLELGDVYYVERKLVDEALPQLIEEASDDELRMTLERHLEQTKEHVERVESAFENLGEEANARACESFDGIVEEHEETMGRTEPSLHDLVVLSTASATEHYEISTYEGLVVQAEAMGYGDVAAMLRENLEDEHEALREGKQTLARIASESAESKASRSGTR